MCPMHVVLSRLFPPVMHILIIFGVLAKPRAGVSCTNGMSTQNSPALRRSIVGGSFAGCLRCTQASITTAPPCRLLELGPLQSLEAQTGRCEGHHRFFRFRISGTGDSCLHLSYLCLQLDAHCSRLLYRSLAFLDVPRSTTCQGSISQPRHSVSVRKNHTKKGLRRRASHRGRLSFALHLFFFDRHRNSAPPITAVV